MHGGQYEIVFVQERIAGLIAGRGRWVERQLGQESFACRIAACDLFELFEIGLARLRAVVSAFEVRLIPAAYQRDLILPIALLEFPPGDGTHEVAKTVASPRARPRVA